MNDVLAAARRADVRVFYVLHHQYRPGDYETWKYIAPIQCRAWTSRIFEAGSWGGEVRREFEPRRGDVVALEHWCSSGFANTDLDHQLKAHGVHHVVVIDLLANTCLEATVRFAAELGYDVTVVTDATASFSEQEMHAAIEVNIPNYASSLMTTTDVVEAFATSATASDPPAA